jgi:hypothetical protein
MRKLRVRLAAGITFCPAGSAVAEPGRAAVWDGQVEGREGSGRMITPGAAGRILDVQQNLPDEDRRAGGGAVQEDKGGNRAFPQVLR